MKTAHLAALAFLLVPGALSQVIPKVKGQPAVVGTAIDPSLNRDSCASTKIGGRALWTCRDTQQFDPDKSLDEQIVSSSASWSDFNDDGSLSMFLTNYVLYGQNNQQPFFPLLADECNTNTCGECGDESRFAIWPDQPPLVTQSSTDGSAKAYTWIQKHHIRADLSEIDQYPATTLYRLDFSGNEQHISLPPVTTVDADFWASGQIPYGNYGNLVHNGTAYLWAQTSAKAVALAKVPAANVENKSLYQYYRNGAWSYTPPSYYDSGIDIPNASAGAQGTYYYSSAWKSFVWIGQETESVSAEFFITTSPSPEGPWMEPIKFYEGENGNYTLGAYSLQANPGLSKEGTNEIYLSYTKNDVVGEQNYYTTPLIHVEWEDLPVMKRDQAEVLERDANASRMVEYVKERMKLKRKTSRHRRPGHMRTPHRRSDKQ
ncbi:MAG: hypothetical protein MMC23_009159 [Stictis urceolatum]|nr:hypothetical protein [Stictis urceolata]